MPATKLMPYIKLLYYAICVFCKRYGKAEYIYGQANHNMQAAVQ